MVMRVGGGLKKGVISLDLVKPFSEGSKCFSYFYCSVEKKTKDKSERERDKERKGDRGRKKKREGKKDE